ncbi:MAG TPA: hypothetical protein VLP30_03645, partial [Desulfatirhabdiaceae bacterium]|nr:hypothetical protein [Desulfatirhabdiaceae bacterium]
SRPADELMADIENGLNRLDRILADRLTRVFTPPWNRCDDRTLIHLKNLGYLAVSRNWNAHPAAPHGLLDIPVHVDLHTRREPNPQDGWDALFQELEAGLASGRCGIMIHHDRMNDAALVFLDRLLCRLGTFKEIHAVHMLQPPP